MVSKDHLLGRLQHDRVTTLDNSVLRTSRSYEWRGMLQNATVGSGGAVNPHAVGL